MIRKSWAALVCASAVLTGCGSSSAGSPQPTGPVETVEASVDERPREIKLDGKDPCALVPRADWEKFYIEKPGVSQESPVFKSPQCYYGTNAGTMIVILVVTEGVDVWTQGGRNADVTEAEPVEGFPAITVVGKPDRQGCFTLVDVADGQYLMADAAVTPSYETRVPKKCDYARQLAESAMKTLVES